MENVLSKEFVIYQLSILLQSVREIMRFEDALCNAISQDEIYELTEATGEIIDVMWNLICLYRGFDDVDEEEYNCFHECIIDMTMYKYFGYINENGDFVPVSYGDSLLFLFSGEYIDAFIDVPNPNATWNPFDHLSMHD